MKYFLDSAKIDEIDKAYKHYKIDGVTTNPKHIMNSGKPFMKAIEDIKKWLEENDLIGMDKFPVSVEINPHLDKTEDIVRIGGRCKNERVKAKVLNNTDKFRDQYYKNLKQQLNNIGKKMKGVRRLIDKNERLNPNEIKYSFFAPHTNINIVKINILNIIVVIPRLNLGIIKLTTRGIDELVDTPKLLFTYTDTAKELIIILIIKSKILIIKFLSFFTVIINSFNIFSYKHNIINSLRYHYEIEIN